MEVMVVYHFSPFHSFACVHDKLLSIMSDSLQPYGLQPARFLCSWDFPGKNTEEGCPLLLQGIFLTWVEPTSPTLASRLFRATRKPVIPFVCRSLQAFSVLPNADSFKVSELFYRLSFSWFGLMVSSWLDSCWMLFTGKKKKNWQYCVLLSLSCWRHMMKLCPITGDVKFHPWWSFSRSLHCKASFSPLLSMIIYGGSWGLWRFCSQAY